MNLRTLTGVLIALLLRSPLKGVLFWRWDAVAASVNYAVGDNALTLASSSSEFTVQILRKYSKNPALLLLCTAP